MTIHEPTASDEPTFREDVLRQLSESGLVDLASLAEAVGRSEDEVWDALDGVPQAHLMSDGTERFADLLTLADGAVLTHEVSQSELETGQLIADPDLILWEILADEDGLPLAGGGRLTVPDEPGDLLQPDVLTGPAGWLDRFKPNEILALRLRNGVIEVSSWDAVLAAATRPDPDAATPIDEVIAAFTAAASTSLERFAHRVADDPLVLASVLVEDVLVTILHADPGVLAAGVSPITELLSGPLYELDHGQLRLAGAPDSLHGIVGLGPDEIISLALTRAALRRPMDDRRRREVLDVVGNGSALLVSHLADDVERDPLSDDVIVALREEASTSGERGSSRCSRRGSLNERDAPTRRQRWSRRR